MECEALDYSCVPVNGQGPWPGHLVAPQKQMPVLDVAIKSFSCGSKSVYEAWDIGREVSFLNEGTCIGEMLSGIQCESNVLASSSS